MDKDIMALLGVVITAAGGYFALRQKADESKVERLELDRQKVIKDLNDHIERLEKRITELERQNDLCVSKLLEMGFSISSQGLKKPTCKSDKTCSGS